MNCAVVKTEGSTRSWSGPGLFRANTVGPDCATVEGQIVRRDDCLTS